MDAVELDRPERLRAWLARQRTVHEVRADGQGGWHWQALAADDAAPFDPPSVLPPFSASSSPSASSCFASTAGSSSA